MKRVNIEFGISLAVIITAFAFYWFGFIKDETVYWIYAATFIYQIIALIISWKE